MEITKIENCKYYMFTFDLIDTCIIFKKDKILKYENKSYKIIEISSVDTLYYNPKIKLICEEIK